jgi:cyclopropane fatty-acyl-phospholipid synthase-like methyltransferase
LSLPNTATIKKLYGPNDLSCCPAFQGGYINFGYWKDIDISNDKLITLEERIIASASLYNRVFAEMNLQGDDSVLEIGCGRGHGCASLLKRFNPKKVCGLDS